MSFWKDRPKRVPTFFCQNECTTFTWEKRGPSIWGYLCIFEKVSGVNNCRSRWKLAQSGHPASAGGVRSAQPSSFSRWQREAFYLQHPKAFGNHVDQTKMMWKLKTRDLKRNSECGGNRR
jgi:hypothetical protein